MLTTRRRGVCTKKVIEPNTTRVQLHLNNSIRCNHSTHPQHKIAPTGWASVLMPLWASGHTRLFSRTSTVHGCPPRRGGCGWFKPHHTTKGSTYSSEPTTLRQGSMQKQTERSTSENEHSEEVPVQDPGCGCIVSLWKRCRRSHTGRARTPIFPK